MNGAGTLPAGEYTLFVTAPNYQTPTPVAEFALTDGATASKDASLDLNTATLDLTVTVAGATPTHVPVVVTLSRTDVTSSVHQPTTLTSASTKNNPLRFSTLVPATYSYDITSDGTAQGGTIQETTGSITVARVGTNKATVTQTLAAASLQTTVSGVVQAPVGPSSVQGIPNVHVDLGYYDNGTFKTAEDVNGTTQSQPSSSTAGSVGSFQFSNVAARQYVVQVNVTQPVNGYTATYSGQFSVAAGQAVYLGNLTLQRVTQTVTVDVAQPNGDDISAASAPTLTSQDYSNFTETGTLTASATGGTDTWTFTQVPFGCWDFSLALPANHYGSVSLSPSQPGTLSTCTGGFTVPGSGSATVDVNYTLSEYQPKASVTLSPLPGNTTAPTTVTVSATTKTGMADYTDSAFAVSDPPPATATATTLPIWVTGTQKISVDVGRAGWSSPEADVNPKSRSAALTSTETGVSVSVTVTHNGDALAKGETATVSLNGPSGITYSATQTASSTASTVTFTKVPAGDGWTATATLLTAATASSSGSSGSGAGSGSAPATTPTGTSDSFDVPIVSPATDPTVDLTP